MVLVALSVSIGRKGKVTMPPTGSNNFFNSFAESSGLNFVRSMLRLSKGSGSRTLSLPALGGCFFHKMDSAFHNSSLRMIQR